LTLLLSRHLASEGLLSGSIPLTGSCEDVLESLLSLAIGNVAGCLAALE